MSLPLRGENPYVRQWKEDGGMVFGYVCSYVPEEVLYGHNRRILPLRMGAIGCETTEDADIYMQRCVCSFSRSLLQLALSGEYDFLDGVVLTNACDQMRRTYEYWRDEVKRPFLAMLTIPHSTQGRGRFEWYRDEIRNLKEAIGARYGCYASDEALHEAIRTYNRYRALMLELYELRVQQQPKLSGSEAMRIVQAGFNMPKDAFNAKLADALEELRERPGIADYRARIMVGGSYLDDPHMIEVIESTGALVVSDNLCSGRRYIEGMVDEGRRPTEAIARRYFHHTACPRMVGQFRARVEFTKKLARDASVDGVIFHRILFCDSHAVENIMESRELEQEGIPTLNLETEYLAADEGRTRTRVQAFLEKLGK
jgi:benzoyl-CoA reductase/2-hydroxyglutaryl-CoA dehydratase subunit BcrC/BadD/HgdB